MNPLSGFASLRLLTCCILLVKFPLATGFVHFVPAPTGSKKYGTQGFRLFATKQEPILVALTREDGKNFKFIQRITSDPNLNDLVNLVEIPCIEHANGPDFDNLGSTLTSQKWDYVVVTSPEAARVAASAWDVVRDNPPPVAAVGKATEETLEEFGIPVTFCPSKATAKTLAAELISKGEGTTVLYPASNRAMNTLQDCLSSRGFAVTRLNTYDTITANWSDEQKEIASKVQVACFASPSSIKGWLYNTGDKKDVIAACIGETSAEACRNHGWPESMIFYPDAPGLEGWADAVKEAMEDIRISHA
jgi:uroporphyrinogen-III synthase